MKQEIGQTQILVFPSALGWFALDFHDAQLHGLVFGYPSAAEAAGALREGSRKSKSRGGSSDDQAACWVELDSAPAAGGKARKTARTRSADADVDEDAVRLARRLQAYADGQHDDFADVPVAADGLTPFQRKVRQQCRRIRYGQTCTYGQLAAKAGSPRAARAVGAVMASNRVPLIVPCHRVVGSTGALHGFSGCGGIGMKRRLLELERAS